MFHVDALHCYIHKNLTLRGKFDNVTHRHGGNMKILVFPHLIPPSRIRLSGSSEQVMVVIEHLEHAARMAELEWLSEQADSHNNQGHSRTAPSTPLS